MNKFALDHPAGAGALSPLNYLIRSPLGVKNWFGGIVLAVFTLFLAASAQAVHVSSSGSGQALVVPFYTVENGFDTLVSVTNTLETSESAAALKVHFLSPEGELQDSFNLYLRRLSTWAFALSEQDGQAVSGPFEAGCLLGDAEGATVPVEQFELDAPHGYIEIVEMGRLTDPGLLSALEEGDCGAFGAVWSDAVLEPPAGGVRASASLINVARATMYSFVATALDNFRDAMMHTAPGEALPDLSSADNHPDHTTSRNCNIAPCVEDAWDDPVDAVSAALMALEVAGEYVVSDSIEGRTEWVTTFPTRRFYPDDHAIHDGAASVDFLNRSGVSFEICVSLGGMVSCEVPELTLELADSIATLRVHGTGSDADADAAERFGIFNLPNLHELVPIGEVSAGLLRMEFFDQMPVLISNSGTEYSGRPVIGLILQEFTNNQVEDAGQPRIANYGNSFQASYSLERTK